MITFLTNAILNVTRSAIRMRCDYLPFMYTNRLVEIPEKDTNNA